MPASNPFEGILTPQALFAKRQAEFAQKYSNVDPMARMAAEAGFNIRESMRQKGFGLDSEDVKAEQNQKIMEEAQKSINLAMENGVDADEAQANALERALKGFSDSGSWESALAISGALQGIRQQQLERRKLKADIANVESQPELKAADLEIKQLTANARLQDSLTKMDQAQTAAERSAWQAEVANARLALELLKLQQKQAEDGKGEKESVARFKSRQAINTGVAGAAETASLMADLREQIAKNPAAATAAGPLATKIAGTLQGARAFVQGNGYDPDLTKEGTDATRWVKLNVADQTQQSLVITLAYSFARANDPGGRLSNQDLEMAKQVVSGGGSPQARLAVLDQAFANLARKTTRDFGTAEDLEIKVGENSRKGWSDAAARYGALVQSQKTAEAAPPGGKKLTAAERAAALRKQGK